MTRNVVRCLNRPCALSQRALAFSPLNFHRQIQYKSPQEVLKEDEADKILRIGDQQALRKTSRQASNFIESIKALKAFVDAIPSTLNNPDFSEQYTLGSIREKVDSTSKQGDEVIEAVENVQAHLRDLALEGYEKKGKDIVREFQQMIEGWSEDEKRDKLKTWKLQEEGRIVRLNDSSQRLVKFVHENLGPGSGRSAMPAFKSKEASAVEAPKVQRPTTSKAEPAAKKASATSTTAPTPSLLDMQRQLEESVGGSNGRK